MNLLRAELLKIRTTNAWWIFALCFLPLLAVSLMINTLIASTLGENQPGTEGLSPERADMARATTGEAFHAANLYTSGQYFGLLFVMLLGIVVVTGEFHHQTATATFLTTPRRELVVLAKLVAAALGGALLWAVTTLIALPVGVLALKAQDAPSHLGDPAILRAIGLNLLAYLLWGMFGVGIGVLIRSQIGATVTAAALYLVGTQVAQGVFMLLAVRLDNMTILEWQVIVPSLASQLMISGAEDFAGQPPQWLGAVILIGYAVVTGVVGTAIMRRRDIS